MAYDNPVTMTYYLGLIDFGDDATAYAYLTGPSGKQGRLKEISLYVVEIFDSATTNAYVQVGTSSDADAYAQLEVPDTTAANTVFNVGDDTDAIISADIAADTGVLVTMTPVEDDSADKGQAGVTIVIDWF